MNQLKNITRMLVVASMLMAAASAFAQDDAAQPAEQPVEQPAVQSPPAADAVDLTLQSRRMLAQAPTSLARPFSMQVSILLGTTILRLAIAA